MWLSFDFDIGRVKSQRKGKDLKNAGKPVNTGYAGLREHMFFPFE